MLNLPKLIGHRGVKNLAPENTLDSVGLAHKLGLKWIEVDVKITKDKIPIILHDDSLDRTTNFKGLVIDFLYKEIKALDAGFFFYNYKTNIFVPTLEDILNFCIKHEIGINIELKPNKGFEIENVKAISKVIYKSQDLNNFYFSSFDLKSLIEMKKIFPNFYYGLLVDNFDSTYSLQEYLKICNNYKFFNFGLNNKLINSEIINEIKKNNLFITTYSDNNIKLIEANDLWKLGVTSIFIDDPSSFEM
ncbi:glycerophosphodiester phosphodiesterase family protein [Alphaproteobacteria bacterium]|nr:glycerophosphodiester phosphodiesterase family protein [Alphaproteobacteria bacterium]